MILDAEERHRLRAGQAVVHNHVAGNGAGGDIVHGDGLRGRNGVRGGHTGHHRGRHVAVSGQRGVVDLNRLPGIDQRGAGRHRHGEHVAADGADGAQHAVAGGLNHFVEEGAELLHPVGYFALGRVLNGLFARVRGVLQQLGDFHRELEENRRDLRHVVSRSRAAAQVAAIGVVGTRLAARNELQRQTHVTRTDFFHVAALLDHGQQDVVPLVQQRNLVPHLLQLQRNSLAVAHCWHLFFLLCSHSVCYFLPAQE